MLVPLHVGVAVCDLHEPHATLGKPPGHQTLAAEIRGHLVIQAI